MFLITWISIFELPYKKDFRHKPGICSASIALLNRIVGEQECDATEAIFFYYCPAQKKLQQMTKYY
jgi:hypothetical protein